MEISSLNPGVKASELPFEKMAASANVSEQDKVTEACRQFEAVLLRQIVGAARKHVINSTANPQSTVNSIYDDMITNQLADGISRSGAFGLAKTLQSQLAHQVLRPADAARGDAAPIDANSHKVTKTPDNS